MIDDPLSLSTKRVLDDVSRSTARPTLGTLPRTTGGRDPMWKKARIESPNAQLFIR